MLESLSSFDKSHRVYKSPPLVLTICQVRFARVLSIADEACVAPFQNAVRRQYPLVERPVEFEVALDMRPLNTETYVSRSSATRNWRFADVNGTWAVVLGQDFITLETRQYRGFDQFLERLSFVLHALVKHIAPELGLRIGLRYIDEIRTPSDDPRVAVMPALLGALTQEELFSHAARSVQEIILQYPDREGVMLRHGYFSSGTTVQPASPEKVPQGPFYLLDTDVFREFVPPDGLHMDVSSICRHVEEYHQAIYRVFRWALQEDYVSSLGKAE